MFSIWGYVIQIASPQNINSCFIFFILILKYNKNLSKSRDKLKKLVSPMNKISLVYKNFGRFGGMMPYCKDWKGASTGQVRIYLTQT